MTEKSKRNKYDEDFAPIEDTPENIAKAIMQGPPKKQWDYLKHTDPGRSDGPVG